MSALQLEAIPDKSEAATASTETKQESEQEAQQALDPAQRFEFTGSGSEYFRIWVVNVLLTILTLGVYSAWAKVRKLQYFYRNTRFAGDVFDYHGNPKAILKGRILAVALLGAYKLAANFSGWLAGAVALVMIALMPWLLARAFRFKLANTSWRGLRFRFRGTVAQAYRTLSIFPIIFTLTIFFVWSLATSFSKPSVGVMLLVIVPPLLLTAGATPLAHYLLKRYQHDNAYFGQAPFFFHAKMKDFFHVYRRAYGMLTLGGVLSQIVFRMFRGIYTTLHGTAFGWLFDILFGLLLSYVSYLLIRPYLESRIQNLVWNNTEVADHRFESTASARRLLWIHASNLALIALTLGLYKPFATVRLMRYRLSCMALIVEGELEQFDGDASAEEVGAVGQEAGDIFDIDIAL